MNLAQGAQPTATGRILGSDGPLIRPLKRLLNQAVEFRLMVEVKRKCGMNLAKRKMRMLNVDFVRAPSVRDMVQRDFDNLDVRVVNPRPPFDVTVNVARCFNGIHGVLSSSASGYSVFARKTTRFTVAHDHDSRCCQQQTCADNNRNFRSCTHHRYCCYIPAHN
jgi:hypothetical protein